MALNQKDRRREVICTIIHDAGGSAHLATVLHISGRLSRTGTGAIPRPSLNAIGRCS